MATSDNLELFSSDRAARKIRVLIGKTVHDVAGSGQLSSFDGSSRSCSFQQPTALFIEGNTLYVSDTTVGRVCVITPTSSLSNYLKQLDTLCGTFAIHLPEEQLEIFSINETIEAVRGVSSTLSSWERKVANELGKKTSAIQGHKDCRLPTALKVYSLC